MKRILIIIIIIIIALIAGSLSSNYFFYKINSTNSFQEYEVSQLDSSSNKNNNIYKNKIVNFDISPKPIKFMENSTFKITNLEGYFKDLNLRIYGLNMDMGTIKAKLIKKDDNSYEAVVALSSCILTIMKYRAEIFDGNKSLGLYVDFDLNKNLGEL